VREQKVNEQKKSYQAEAKIKDPDAPTTDREAANAVTAKRLFL
jgi:hypothetical protein